MSGARWAEPGRSPPAKPSISSTPRPKVPIAPLVRWSTKRGATCTDTLERGERLSTRQHTLIRLAMAHATWSAHEVAMFAYASAGTVALRSGTLQRLFRDMHAGIQHVTSSPPVFQAIGRDLAGLAPNAEWRFLDLVSASPSA